MRTNASLKSYNTTYDSNIAADDGGAISIITQGDGHTVDQIFFENNTFYNNQAYGVDSSGSSGGAIQIFANVGRLGKLETVSTFKNNSFISNKVGKEGITDTSPGGGALAASLGLSPRSSIKFNLENNLFIDNELIAKDGTITKDTTYVNINYKPKLITQGNNIGMPKANVTMNDVAAVDITTEEVLGEYNISLQANNSGTKAGKENIIIPTVTLKPNGVAEGRQISDIAGVDQRGFNRKTDAGAIEITHINYITDKGFFELDPIDTITNAYYQLDDNNKTTSYYLISNVGKTETILGTENINLQYEGYSLAGWSLNPDSSTKDYSVGEIITMDDNLVLYAIWEKVEIYYTVSYKDGFGGTVFADEVYQVLEGGGTPSFSQGIPTKPGYIFMGWDKNINPTVTESVEYTAVWNKIQYTVTFHSNNGSHVDPITGLFFGDNVIKPTDPTLSGNHFVGWYLDESFTSPVDFDTYMIASDVDMFAKWEEDSEGTDPIIPVDPTDPVKPVDPTDPVNPVDPIKPVGPKEPSLPGTGVSDSVVLTIGFALIAIGGLVYVIERKRKA